MLALPLTFLRVLGAHWPALVAWFLVGYLGRYLAIEGAGWVGGHTAVGGMVLLPIAVLIRMISMVAMFLVVRESLAQLQIIAPLPEDRKERRKTFIDAALSAVLPFFAVYAAWGFLRQDVMAYSIRALEVSSGVRWTALVETGEVAESGPVATDLRFSVTTVAIIVFAFALRWAWKRWGAKLPKAVALVAVYLEAVWVFFSLLLISQAIDLVRSFIDSRVAMVWLAETRAWVAEWFTPVSVVWDAIGWFLGEAGGILLLPLAWLTLAGVVYGQAIAPERLRIEHRVITRAKTGWARVPGAIQQRLKDVFLDLISRFRPIGRALLLMWRAGPVPVAIYVLLYTLMLLGESSLRLGMMRLIGPQDFFTFWAVADTVLFAIVPLVIEPIRVALIAAAYDTTLGALRARRAAADEEAREEVEEAAEEEKADPADQESASITNRKNRGSSPKGATSTQNGPEIPSGMT